MNEKKQLSPEGKKRAAAGLAVCFTAAIVLTGIYTWTGYKDRSEQELARAEQEAQIRREQLAGETQAASSKAEKAKEEKTQAELPEADSREGTAVSANAEQVNFTENSRILWPVDGNVLMSYKMDGTVYFKTLDQYKYNPAIIISGAEGDSVIASAPGVVKSIDVLPQTGTTVTVDMGNGYECHYGQLKEVPVTAGSYVTAGTVLGYLSEPTKYYSLEGCNLYFEMRKDGQPVNPIDYMAEEDVE